MENNDNKQKAIEAGESAVINLNKALDELSHARKWGIADMLGGRYATVKYSYLENAGFFMDEAKKDLNVFSSNLPFVAASVDLDLQISKFLKCYDQLSDGTIHEWPLVDSLVQEKIKETKNQVKDVLKKVEIVLSKLKECRK